MLAELTKCAPELSRWVHFLYGSPSKLFFGDTVIFSRTGTHQGDPLAMHLFCIAIHPTISALRDKYKEHPVHAWYADDGAIVLPRRDVHSLIYDLQRTGSPNRYEPQPHKNNCMVDKNYPKLGHAALLHPFCQSN